MKAHSMNSLSIIGTLMQGNHFIDFRNIYEPDDVAKFGFQYDSVGRPKA